jgi:hypothetical protein
MSKKHNKGVNKNNAPKIIPANNTEKEPVIVEKVDKKESTPKTSTVKVETVKAEEVKKPLPAPISIGTNVTTDLQKSIEDSKISLDTLSRLAYVSQRRYMDNDKGGKKPDAKLVEMADSMMDPIMVLSFIKLRGAVNNDYEAKLLLNKHTTNALKDACALFGVTLPDMTPKQLENKNDDQLELKFTDVKVPKELAKEAKADEKKDEKAKTDIANGIETKDATKITKEQLPDSLNAILHGSKYMNGATLFDAITFLRAFDVQNAKDENAKDEAKKATIGDLIQELCKIVGTSFLINGMSSLVRTNIKNAKNPISSFLLVKKAFQTKSTSDETIADLVASLVEVSSKEKAIEKLSYTPIVKTEVKDKDGNAIKDKAGDPVYTQTGGEKIKTTPSIQEISHEMSAMPELNFLLNPLFDVDTMLKNYVKATTHDKDKNRVVDPSVAADKMTLGLLTTTYFPKDVKNRLDNNTLTEDDKKSISEKLNEIANYFKPLDARTTIDKDFSFIDKLRNKIKDVCGSLSPI